MNEQAQQQQRNPFQEALVRRLTQQREEALNVVASVTAENDCIRTEYQQFAEAFDKVRLELAEAQAKIADLEALLAQPADQEAPEADAKRQGGARKRG